MTPERIEEMYTLLAQFNVAHNDLSSKPAYTTYAVALARICEELLSSIESLQKSPQTPVNDEFGQEV